MDKVPLWEWFSIFVCLVLSGYFSATETALTALPSHKARKLLRGKHKRVRMLALWLVHPNRVLTTILIGNNIVNLAAAALVSRAAYGVFGDWGVAGGTGALTLVILIFGEIMPKTFAKHHAEALAPKLAQTLVVPYILFYPFSRGLVRFIHTLVRKMGGDSKREGPFFTPEDIRDIIHYSSEEGGLEKERSDMLGRVFELRDTVVREIMIPRIEVAAISAQASYDEVLQIVVTTGHSRIPVYQDSLDNIRGLVYVKDLLKYPAAGKDRFRLMDCLREPYYVPETKDVTGLLREFQRRRKHMAIVVDEYGGTAGLVTLEDILEEIVGEIEDEYDAADDDVVSTSPNTFSVKAKINIEDMEERLGIKLRENDAEDYESLGGFICAQLGRVPKKGEILSLPEAEIRIEESTPKRIVRVRLIRREKSSLKKDWADGRRLSDSG